MPVIDCGNFRVDYQDVGSGPAVVLVHGAASNNRQWRQLVEENSEQYRFLSPNLFGYGQTSSWPGETRQCMADQVQIVKSICELIDERLNIVGHSFGGSVAAATAHALGEKVNKLVLLEANPFPLLRTAGQEAALAEIEGLWDFISQQAAIGEWSMVAERFVNYWLGEGSWQALNEDRQQSFIAALPNNVHEWDTIMNMDVSSTMWQGIKADTIYLRASQTTLSIRGINEVLKGICPHWRFGEISEGGHMAPMTRPDLVNPMIIEFLQSK